MCSDYRKPRGIFDFLKFLAIVVMIILLILAVGWVVMYLWNQIIPSVIGWNPVTYWQAIGLLILSKILFGGFRKGGWKDHSSRWHRKKARLKERWKNMSDEEKAEFKQKWRRGE